MARRQSVFHKEPPSLYVFLFLPLVYDTDYKTARVVVKCPLTGRPAIYRDPRSGVPYANARAFKSLTHLLSQEYAWNEKLACYTVREGDVNAPDAV